MSRKKAKPGEAKSDRKKAYYLRGKITSGGSLNPEQSAWLAAYELATGRSAPDAPPSDDPAHPSNAEDLLDPAPPPVVDAPPPVDFPDPLPLDPPPRSAPEPESAGKKSGGGGAWQDKYRNASNGPIKSDGREQVVTFIADQWSSILDALCEGMRDADIKPLIEPTYLRNAIILTVDEMLPQSVSLSPRRIAVIGTSTIVIQRFARGKAIAEARKEKTARDSQKSKIDKMKERTAEQEARYQKEQAESLARQQAANSPPAAPQTAPQVAVVPDPAPTAVALVRRTSYPKLSPDDVI